MSGSIKILALLCALGVLSPYELRAEEEMLLHYVPGETEEIDDPQHFIYIEVTDAQGKKIYGRTPKTPHSFLVGKRKFLFNGMWMLECGEPSGFGEVVKCEKTQPLELVSRERVATAASLEVIRKHQKSLQDFENRSLKNYWIQNSKEDLKIVKARLENLPAKPVVKPSTRDPVEKLTLQVAARITEDRSWTDLSVDEKLQVLEQAKIEVETEFYRLAFGEPGAYVNAGYFIPMERDLILKSMAEAVRLLPKRIEDPYLARLAAEYSNNQLR